VFNKIVGLKDSWGKKEKPKEEKKPQEKKIQIDGEVEPMTEAEQALFDKYTNELKLNSMVADILARDEKLSSFYEDILSKLDYIKPKNNFPKVIANIVVNDVAREFKKEYDKLNFTTTQVLDLAYMIHYGDISNKIAKEVFDEIVKTGENPKQIVEAKGLIQISDPSQISPIIDEIIAKNPDNVEKFKAGNTKLLGFFVGQVLKSTGGKANPQVVNELVAEKLK
jgi:glutaminyl-tRNA synthetase